MFGQWPPGLKWMPGAGGKPATPPLNPFVTTGALGAWRAEDTTFAAGLTTSWVPFVGATTLLPNGTGQVQRAVNAGLGNRLAVPFVSGVRGGYSGVPFGVAPAAATILTVTRPTAATTGGFAAVTVAGAVNSGFAQIEIPVGGPPAFDARSRKGSLDYASTVGLAAPVSLIFLSIFTVAGVSHFLNALTPQVVAGGGALAGTTFALGILDATTGYTINAGMALASVWNRALTLAEAQYVISWCSARYSVAIAP